MAITIKFVTAPETDDLWIDPFSCLHLYHTVRILRQSKGFYYTLQCKGFLQSSVD